MTRSVFQEAVKKLGGRFGLDWGRYYHALDALLVGDAYEHYKEWAMKHRVALPETKKRRLSIDDGATDEWAAGMAANPAKKQKQEDDGRDIV